MTHQIIEKEIKILAIDKPRIVEELQSRGATPAFQGWIEDIYYDTPTPSLKKKYGKRVRIRIQGDEIYITMKKKVKGEGLKAREEQEVSVPDVATADRLLRSYGLTPQWKKKKFRTAYRYQDMHFDIDEYDHLPPLLEIEATTEEAIYTWIEKLDLQKKTIATFGARGLFKHYDMSHILDYA